MVPAYRLKKGREDRQPGPGGQVLVTIFLAHGTSPTLTCEINHPCVRGSWGRTAWRRLAGQLWLKYSPSSCPSCLQRRDICCQKLLAEVGTAFPLCPQCRKTAKSFQPTSSHANELSPAPQVKGLGEPAGQLLFGRMSHCQDRPGPYC